MSSPHLNPTYGSGGLGGGADQTALRNLAVKKYVRAIENFVIFALIMQFSTVLVALVTTDPVTMEQTSSIARLLWYPGYVAVLVLTLSNLSRILRIVAFNPLLVLCVLWCGLSMFWSIDQQVTIRRSIALLMTTLFGLFLASRYDWDELILKLATVFLLCALISLFLGLAVPSLGRMQEIHAGAWRGGWLEKNSFGTNMAKGVLLMLCAFAMRPKQYWIWIPAALLCFGLVILSTSKAALLAALVAILGFFAIRIFRKFPILRIPLMYGIVVSVSLMAFLLLFMPDMMFDLIGKERTLTGRTDIWNALAAAIKEHPILGYGYGTFWQERLGPSYWVRLSLEWGVPTAHNGWIETWLSAGVVAVIMFAILFVLTMMLALDRLYRGGVENYWVILSTILFLMISLSESTILQQNDLSWVVFVATSAKMFSFSPAYWRDRPSTPYFQMPERRGR
ncbi:MAG: hypothetical protein COA43_12925 [Robiginitomaculum sp.]|nr:MAG: hypothetical protein COA43_12925 [Robiginitomaculum sp.]